MGSWPTGEAPRVEVEFGVRVGTEVGVRMRARVRLRFRVRITSFMAERSQFKAGRSLEFRFETGV